MFFRFLLKRKTIVGLFITFIFIFGAFGLMRLDKELFPPITFDQAMVNVETEDMPATDVEEFITQPLETALDGVDGVKGYESTSSIGNSSTMITLEDGKGEKVTEDIETAVNNLKEEMHGVKDIQVMQAATDQPFEFHMDITGDDLEKTSKFAKDIVKPRLEALPEVREVDLTGLEEKEITIELKTDKLEKYGLEHDEVIQIIEQTNKNESLEELT